MQQVSHIQDVNPLSDDGEDLGSQDVRPKGKRVYYNFTERQEEVIVE